MSAQFDEVERRSGLSIEEIQTEYLDQDRPVILTDFVAGWPALRRWTPEFFKSTYGHRDVDIFNMSFQDPGKNYLKPTGKMPFGEYIDLVGAGPTDIRLFGFYLFQFAPELRGDIQLPGWMNAVERHFVVTFFGGAGGYTTFHYDVDLPHLFHVILHGSKEFYLFPPSETPNFYQHPFTVRSYINCREPDLGKYPRFANVRGQHCVVRAGETLVIPSRQWHQVFYPEASWGLALRRFSRKHVPRALMNMVFMENVDKMLTKMARSRWHAWKENRAHHAA